MLHEVLLALSGHPSPLFKDNSLDQNATGEFPLLSPTENALLQSIGQLSELHRKLRDHVEQIALHNGSMICRAAATSIQQIHLTRFQDKILEVESRILKKDTNIVGAYDIVPLSGIVGEFDDWHRRMAWYWDMACFIQSPTTSGKASSSKGCTGAALIDKLRVEQQTGFPDIEQVAVELSKVAETAWLRQVASWVLHGKLPSFGADDFFIHVRKDEDAEGTKFSKEKEKLPRFITPSTAASILFIGKSLHQVRRYGTQARTSNTISNKAISETGLASANLQQLAALSLPIVPAQLSRTISAIRLSISQNVLRHLLPMEMTLELLSCLKWFFLLGRGEFAVALISEADSRIQARQQSMNRLLQQDPVKALQGLSIKDAELHQVLSATWKSLASLDEDLEDDILEVARECVSLSKPLDQDFRPSTSDSVHGASSNISSISFNDLLFPSSTSLSLKITPPLDLFLSQREVETYSAINAYLLAIRRAQLRLSDLWRRTAARRDHPSPRVNSNIASSGLANGRDRIIKRRVATRKVWATCSAAIFLVSEASAYFEGEIIRESWDRFEDWVKTPISNEQAEGSEMRASTDSTKDVVQRDPETLASGHRTFLAALTYALLLNDVPFTRELRSLLGNIDHLIAFFNRLLDVQRKLDLEFDSSGETVYTAEEEQRYSLELDRVRKKVDSDLKSVVNRLRQLDHERIGSARYLNAESSESGFEPWIGGGVDRLLMKLEFGRVDEGGFKIV